MLESDGTMDVQLSDEVAVQMNFRRDFNNSDHSQVWATGVFRHLNATQNDALLGDLLGNRRLRDVLLRVVGPEIEPRPIRRLPVIESGGGGFAGGESEEHRKLKEYVAANPEKVGLPRTARAEIEFPYLSGDQVDVKFDMPDGSAAVVEIETIHGWTGAHQCIKYRALLEAALGRPLGGGGVQAILVAHVFDEQTIAFAKKYGIKTAPRSAPPATTPPRPRSRHRSSPRSTGDPAPAGPKRQLVVLGSRRANPGRQLRQARLRPRHPPPSPTHVEQKAGHHLALDPRRH
ncbi:hypothetical protein [Enhygromyxa salina]|uniref:hypothetical protein n=1 Tax=Enhygromyxa salina TaxID=215803 RepID=UPI0011BAAEAC|nr:hypothetical protein [Enhygromyxa salina]